MDHNLNVTVEQIEAVTPTKLYNLTPHDLTFIVNRYHIYLKSTIKNAPRVIEVKTDLGNIAISKSGLIPMNRIEPVEINWGDYTPKDGDIIIVSRAVAMAYKQLGLKYNKLTVMFPNDFIRDKKGNIVGAQSLSMI